MRRLRQERGYTLEVLAEDAGLHWTYLSGIERGRRNASVLSIVKLAVALNVPVADLFAGIETHDSPEPPA